MSNLSVYSVTPEQHTLRLKAAVLKEMAKLPVSDGFNTADYVIHLKDRLDKGIINYALFRAVRDELTYRGRL